MKNSVGGIATITFCLALSFFSCQQDLINPAQEEEQILGYPGVDEALWIYFERFEEEAAERGLDIDLTAEDLTGEIVDLDEDQVVGQCTYGTHITNEVTIDRAFWNRANTFTRELVVFHELGHCQLLRGHDESETQQGVCLSIMASGTTDCRTNYRTSTRDAYLDELFSKSGDIFDNN